MVDCHPLSKGVFLCLGLPISLKDQINIERVESTMGKIFFQISSPASQLIFSLSPSFKGYVSWIGRYASKNSVLADILESLGAVLYVKTNIPQTLMVPSTICTRHDH